MKSSVLVTKRIFSQAIDYLKQHADVEYVETDDGLPSEELMRRIQGKHGIVSQLTDKFTPAVLERLPDLRVISNVAVGFDNVDVPAATKRKIFVTNTPDVLTDTTADFAFALLMAGARRGGGGPQFFRSGPRQKRALHPFLGQAGHQSRRGIFCLGRDGGGG